MKQAYALSRAGRDDYYQVFKKETRASKREKIKTPKTPKPQAKPS